MIKSLETKCEGWKGMKELKESILNYRMVRDNSGLFMEADKKFKFPFEVFSEVL